MALPDRTIVYLVAPKIVEILREIIRHSSVSKTLKSLKIRLYNLACDITNEIVFDITRVSQTLLEAISTPKMFRTFGEALLDITEEWVRSTETKWDDEIVLPALKQFRLSAGIDEVCHG